MHLHLDFETRSRLDIKKVGLENYARSAEALILAYALGDQAPQIWALADGRLPSALVDSITSPMVTKLAWNAAFERAILKYVFKIDSPVEQWIDPATMARYASAGASLDMTGKVLGLGAEAKLEDGKRLMKMFSFAGKRGHRTPEEAPEEFVKYQEYCAGDVKAERAVMRKLHAFALPERERKIWLLDQKINERGIPLDSTFVANAQKLADEARENLMRGLTKITGLENANSNKQLLGWLKEREYPFGSLGAAWVRKALVEFEEVAASDEAGVDVRDALRLRQELAKTSTKKLAAFDGRVGPDGRIRYNYKFYGGHTGRWAGEGAQLQNLPRGVIKDVEGATEAIRALRSISEYGNPLDVISSCLRSAFRAPDGKQFVVCDLSTIEVRVLAWMANCQELLGIFARGGDPYITFAAKYLYRIPESEVTKRQRQIAKSAVLGCGFGMGPGRLEYDENDDEIKTGLWGYAENMGIDMTREEAEKAVAAYRGAYPEIVHFWYNTGRAAISATLDRSAVECCKVIWTAGKSLLSAVLPCGRRLNYVRPIVEDGDLSYECVNSLTKKWGRRRTYGGHLVENLVQAIARDVLAEGMLRADAAGFDIVGHTHDEIICCEPDAVSGAYDLAHLRDLMTEPMPWALDLPLAADGYTAQTYRK